MSCPPANWRFKIDWWVVSPNNFKTLRIFYDLRGKLAQLLSKHDVIPRFDQCRTNIFRSSDFTSHLDSFSFKKSGKVTRRWGLAVKISFNLNPAKVSCGTCSNAFFWILQNPRLASQRFALAEPTLLGECGRGILTQKHLWIRQKFWVTPDPTQFGRVQKARRQGWTHIFYWKRGFSELSFELGIIRN